jgi:hypothetical protein
MATDFVWARPGKRSKDTNQFEFEHCSLLRAGSSSYEPGTRGVRLDFNGRSRRESPKGRTRSLFFESDFEVVEFAGAGAAVGAEAELEGEVVEV